MLSVDAVRARVAALLSGQLSLDDFEDWIVSSSWNQIQHFAPELRQLVGAVELRLAEYSSEHLDRSELLAELQALLLFGCARDPFQSAFISIADQSMVVTMTMSDGPDYQFRLDRTQTSPLTRTGSAKTVVRDHLAVA